MVDLDLTLGCGMEKSPSATGHDDGAGEACEGKGLMAVEFCALCIGQAGCC